MKEATLYLMADTYTWTRSLNARLITADEVAKITENTKFDASKTGQSYFYLDSNNSSQTATSKGASKYAWLFDYTYGCTNNGCNVANSSNYGYWTSTPTSGGSKVWLVYCRGMLFNGSDADNSGYGIRPVITVSKDIIQ